MPLHIIIAGFFALCAYKYGDWKNWKVYYNTILFFDLGDLMYAFLFRQKPLWQFSSPNLSSAIIELLWLFMLFPSIILLFLPQYLRSKNKVHKSLKIFTWIIGFSILEWFIYKMGYINYKNGWQYLNSIIFYCLMFPLLLIHHFKPLLAILFAALWGVITIICFQIPL